jgi:nuclear RNA export factor
MEDNDEMLGMESLSYVASPTPNYPLPPYQQNTFSSYQLSSMNLQQQQQQLPPLYQSSLHTSAMLNQSISNFQQSNQQISFQQQNHSVAVPSPSVNFQSNPQQSNMAFPMSNSTSSGSPSVVPVNQQAKEVLLNLNNDANSNLDTKLSMIKSFSDESGMNDEWAKK